MATHFRQLGPDDADLFTQQLVTWHRGDRLPVSPLQTRRDVARILGNNEEWHAWLIQDGDSFSGYLVLHFRSATRAEVPRAYVAAFYVPPALRHLRLGRAAHRLVTDLARWLGVRVFEFDTEREDKHLHWSPRGSQRMNHQPMGETLMVGA